MKKNDSDFKTLKKWVKDCRKHENDSRSKQEKPWSKNQTPNIDYIEHVLEDVEEKDDNDQVFMSFFNDYYDKTAIFLKKIILPISNYSRDWYPESIEDNLNRNGLYNEIQKSIHKKQWKEFPKYVNGDVEYFFRRMLSMREEDEGKVSENVHKRFLDLKIQNTGNNRLDWSTFHAEASQLLEDFNEIKDPPGEPRIIERFKQILRSDDRTKLILTDMLIGKVGLKDPYTMLDTLDETYLEIYPRDVEIRKVKSLISRIVDDESDSSSESQKKKKKKKKKKKNFDSSKDKSQFPCFKEAREKGKCGRKNCPYSHDVKILDEYRNSKISNSSSDLKFSLCHKTGHVSKNCPNVDKGDDKPISDMPKIPTKVALDSTLSQSQIVNLILNSTVGNQILDEGV